MQVLLENPDTFLLMSAMACLLVGSGFFSASETALFFLSTDEVQAFQKSDRHSEHIVVALLKQPDRLLTAVLFWNLLINLTFFACGVVISGQLVESGHGAVAGVFGVLSLSLMIIFGEVVPKSGAVMFRQPLARLVSFPLAFAALADFRNRDSRDASSFLAGHQAGAVPASGRSRTGHRKLGQQQVCAASGAAGSA